MNWNSILTDALTALIGVIVSGLGIYITYLINKHIKNEQLKMILNSLNNVVKNAVLETYQTYVEELKCKNMFDAEAQKMALTKSLELIKANMPIEVKKWLETNYTNIEGYLKSLIEAQIGLLKNQNKK